MKKLLFSFVFAGTTALSFGQQFNIDFESLVLPQIDTFYNGADLGGDFTLSNGGLNAATFSNTFTTSQWGDYWNGFSYSNMTDVVTAGFENQYSAYAGSGANGSAVYGVFYPEGVITLQGPAQMDSIKITNTTYAALTMLNGNAFSKVFGSPNDAQGTPDGTNGEDFLRVWIIALDGAMAHTDSVEFYLADYRFADNSQDYIVNNWVNVDLSSFGFVSGLTFRFESSDMSFGYINTPTYFALDDLHFTNVLNVEEIAAGGVSIYPNPVSDILKIVGPEGEITLLDVEGKELLKTAHKQQSTLDFSGFNPGIYFVRVNHNEEVTIHKIVKQ
ncbi:MAG: hypothetical protein K0R65_1652 [Crocinitomicaceae bacterium]|jgi:hypothetical protein|nr:hypothetical protein [Crocinitomicaceae bacterium]